MTDFILVLLNPLTFNKNKVYESVTRKLFEFLVKLFMYFCVILCALNRILLELYLNKHCFIRKREINQTVSTWEHHFDAHYSVIFHKDLLFLSAPWADGTWNQLRVYLYNTHTLWAGFKLKACLILMIEIFQKNW